MEAAAAAAVEDEDDEDEEEMPLGAAGCAACVDAARGLGGAPLLTVAVAAVGVEHLA